MAGRRPAACCTLPAQPTLPRSQGLGVLALGAGVGEETLFRAFLQSQTVAALASAQPSLAPATATALGVGASSLVFGALHALTPSYFVYATVGGAVLGEQTPALLGRPARPAAWLTARRARPRRARARAPASTRPGRTAAAGVEYLVAGLPAAAITHALYDWIALSYILRKWGSLSAGSSSGEDGGAGGPRTAAGEE